MNYKYLKLYEKRKARFVSDRETLNSLPESVKFISNKRKEDTSNERRKSHHERLEPKQKERYYIWEGKYEIKIFKEINLLIIIKKEIQRL